MKYCTHLSREQAENVTEPTGAVLVSITSPSNELATVHLPAWQDVLRLQFDDIAVDSPESWGAGYIPPQKEHAEAITAFVRLHERSSIVAHCEAGISRSAAVCVVLKGLGWRYLKPHEEGLGRANPLLLRLLLKEFSAFSAEGACVAQ